MNRIINVIKKDNVSLLFSILGIELLFYSFYGVVDLFYISLIAILSIMYFAIYDKMSEDNRKATIIYLFTAVISVAIAYFSIGILGSSNEITLGEWLFKSGQQVSFEFSYAFGAIILISFLFSTMYYYFSVKLIRMSVLLLLIFITMIIYIRGPYERHNIFIYTYLLCFFVIYIKSNFIGEDNSGEKIRLKYKSYIGFSTLIILILFFIASLIPISKAFPEIEFLSNARNVLRDFSISSIFRGFSIENNGYRKTNESVSDNSNLVLFSYKGEQVKYLISHTFDYYDIKDESWIETKNGYNYGTIFDERKNILKELDTTKKILEESKTLSKELENIKNAESDEDLLKSIIIKSEYKNSSTMIHPSKTYNMKGEGRDNIYLNKYQEIFLNDNRPFEVGDEYRQYYIKDEPKEGSKESLIMKTMNKELYERYFYNEISDNFSRKLCLDVEEIFDVYTALDSNTSDRMKELAEELTNNNESYYDKAKAIESYFKSGKYTYNKKISTNNSSNYIDYFIFESKEGYCVQYATAMTLMCRTLGIPTRYVEGYLVSSEDTIDEGYEVNASRAHAFVEVYIPGYGWKVFDPTPSSTDESLVNNTEERNNINFDFSLSIFIISIISLVLISLIIILILKLTKRKRLLRKIIKAPIEESLDMLIGYSVSLLKEVDLIMRNGETILKFSERVDKKLNIGFNNFIEDYYSKKYALKKFEQSDINAAIKMNNDIYNLIKDKKRVQ